MDARVGLFEAAHPEAVSCTFEYLQIGDLQNGRWFPGFLSKRFPKTSPMSFGSGLMLTSRSGRVAAGAALRNSAAGVALDEAIVDRVLRAFLEGDHRFSEAFRRVARGAAK